MRRRGPLVCAGLPASSLLPGTLPSVLKRLGLTAAAMERAGACAGGAAARSSVLAALPGKCPCGQFATVGCCSDVCCRVSGSLGQQGRKAGAAQAAARSSASGSPEIAMTSKARIPFPGASVTETVPCLLCKSSATQGKVINLRA